MEFPQMLHKCKRESPSWVKQLVLSSVSLSLQTKHGLSEDGREAIPVSAVPYEPKAGTLYCPP